ncbi:MAG: RNA polymerase subunit sigma-24 [Acidobacteria bacterium]|nr:MAG: RNA polymerase subunit sigma-24 [Acidobacteriota bacterium]PYV25451.1 MAG: RNA polymerase subunit sigma-24 [Acidobacteriota bacterium]
MEDTLRSTDNDEILRDEQGLIRLGLKGNQAALEALFARHSGALYQSALKLLGNPEDAEDALQEGMLSAFKNLRRFEGRSKFSSWLTRIVINAALMRLRSQRAHQTVSADQPLGEAELTLAEQLADPAPDPERLYAREEMRQLLDRNLTELSPEMRTAVRLRDIEGLSTQEAAEALGVPENTLKSRLHRARLQLAEQIQTGAA